MLLQFCSSKRFVLMAGAGLLIVVASFLYFRSSESIVYENIALVAPVIVEPPLVHIETPEPVRAIYMSSWVAGTPSMRNSLAAFVKESEINSIVIDVKDYSGKIILNSDRKALNETGALDNRAPDLDELIKELHEKNIYIIARITAFQDPYYSKIDADGAIKDSRGGLWKDSKGLTYMDPAYKPFWKYLVEIGKAAESSGFDELNFDYIRYPSDGRTEYAVYQITKGKTTKADILEDFFKYLHAELWDVGIPMSADLLGLTTYFYTDLHIGQVLERAEPYFDYLSPMVYPSHYPANFWGYKNPAENPYEIVSLSMNKAVQRMLAASSSPDKLRPWLQDFDLGANYDAEMVKKEIKAVHDAGLDSWMMWNPKNIYTKSVYKTYE